MFDVRLLIFDVGRSLRSKRTHLSRNLKGELTLQKQRERVSAFTLAELLVSVGVLVLLTLLATQLLNNAATIMTLGHRQMDADSQARELFDRMAIDFAQMIRRSDVDYYLKASTTDRKSTRLNSSHGYIS